ncbi:unnamed protein product, partial [Mesorhabditis belari]|uniref:Peptidase C1A papain C-terminal domain-containing protein n=1 Tax=Mesorhabditis belari TaxID=2138241 RepID=A0AAF3ELJ5_9BILA
MWKLLAFGGFIVVVLSQTVPDIDDDNILDGDTFKHFKNFQNKCKVQCSAGEAGCKQRKQNFGKNMKKMAAWNKTCTTDDDCHHTLGWTCFTGHSKEELQMASVGNFDWRTTGAVNPIKDQEQCGDCWSFASVAAIEITSNYVNGRINASRRQYSEQWLTDCSTTNGCDGGWPSNALAYVQTHGIPRGAADTYKGIVTSCPKSIALEKPVSAQSDLTGNPVTIQQFVLSKGPVTAAFMVCEDFMYYTSGIYSTDCTETNPNYLGGHAVTIIGYGTSATGVDYWLVRNQWGTGWGIGGYFQIRRGKDTSSIEAWGVTGLTCPKIA